MTAQEGTSSTDAIKCVLLMFALLSGPNLMILQTSIVPGGLRANVTSSMTWPVVQFGQGVTYREAQLQRIRSIRGKYAFVPTSSEAFASQKQLEIDFEG
jgi:hypothetical protein